MSKIFTITEGLQNLGALRTGGQGSVYKARRYGEIITAVKLLPTPIHSESPSDKNYVNFQNEVEKLRKVNAQPNPNVVKILSSGITDTGSLPFIEMEFIEGPDLEELLRPPHPQVFTIKETIRVAEHLSNALAHCHRMDVKHGDIKSNNVKFNIHSGNYILLDFGLAAMSDEQRRTSLRQAGAIEFMAPEQNEGKMYFQTDVYSFGVILYELLAGSVPFPLRDSGETSRNLVMLAHMESKPPDLLDLRREHLPAAWSEEKKLEEMNVPDWLLRMIARCLEKKVEHRYLNGVALHDYIVRNSIATTVVNKPDDQKIKSLLQENETLKRERDLLRQQLRNYNGGQEYTKPVPFPATTHRPRRFGSTFFAFILTALVVALILFFALQKNEKTNANPANSQQEKPKQPIGQFKVMSARAYFHNSSDSSTRREAYVTPASDVITGLEEKNGFIYTEYTNSRGQLSKGWLRKQDLMPLAEWNNRKPAPLDDMAGLDINAQLKEAANYLSQNLLKEALYIYGSLAKEEVPEAMFNYANLALQNRNDAIDCGEALMLLDKASEAGYAPAKRVLGFLYIFAENTDVLASNNYDHCTYEKNAAKGTQLLIQANRAGDTLAREILERTNLQTSEPGLQQ